MLVACGLFGGEPMALGDLGLDALEPADERA